MAHRPSTCRRTGSGEVGRSFRFGLPNWKVRPTHRQISLIGLDNTAEYVYNALGRRVAKVLDGETTYDLYNAGYQVIEERDADNTLQTRYTYGSGIDRPLTMERGGSVYYYHRDGLGSVTEISDQNGNLVERYEYDVYGRPQIFDSSDTELTASAIDNPYLFTGRRFDPESGNYYYRARIYSPELGRFLQTDPLGYVDGLNLYAYVGNNPASWVDPLGTVRSHEMRSAPAGLPSLPPGVGSYGGGIAFPRGSLLKGILGTGVIGFLKDLFAPSEELPPLPGTPVNTEPTDTGAVTIPEDLSWLWDPLITPDDGVCYPEPEIFPGHGDDPLLDPVIADPITESVGPPIYVAENGEDGIKETFGSLEAATGQLGELEDVEKTKTKEEFMKEHGFTEKWTGQNSYTGEWWSAFRNPKTGKFTGGHKSSRSYW